MRRFRNGREALKQPVCGRFVLISESRAGCRGPSGVAEPSVHKEAHVRRKSFVALSALLLAAFVGATGLTTTGTVEAARGPYHAASPEYGLSVFAFGHPETSDRDLDKITGLGFGWQKSTFQWRAIEAACKGCFDWSEADRVVADSKARNLKIIARLDFSPVWARADGAFNGPPDNYQDFADFVYAFVSRYASDSPIGPVQAVEVWNEVNLDREWGMAQISEASAADYVRLLKLAYKAAKGADPSVTVIAAGLSPTDTTDGAAQPDVTYLQWEYNQGLKGSFDVMAANANVQCPCIGDAPLSRPGFDHPSFYFRRVEQIHDVMVANGDTTKQIWLLEFGWTTDSIHPSYSWYHTDEATKSELIVSAFKYAHDNWTPWIGVMTLWTISDPSWGPDFEQVWWAVTNPDGTTRPAYDRLVQARAAGELP
jgi:hypothetical protein